MTLLKSLSAAFLLLCVTTAAQAGVLPFSLQSGGKLLLTGGVTEVEGQAGGGLTPWAVIGGYGSPGQVGGNVFGTKLTTQDYDLTSKGFMVGAWNRVEVSYARQDFDTRNIGAALGLGYGYSFHQDVVGLKVRVIGDAVLEQDAWLPQIAVGAQFKSNKNGALVKALGARRDKDTDYYVSATKLFLGHGVLLNGTLRATRANQFGILGYGGTDDKYRLQAEASAAWMLSRKLVIGVEARSKPDNLAVAKEGPAVDAFIAYAPCRQLSLTVAYADLGNIVTRRQSGLYVSLQAGF